MVVPTEEEDVPDATPDGRVGGPTEDTSILGDTPSPMFTLRGRQSRYHFGSSTPRRLRPPRR